MNAQLSRLIQAVDDADSSDLLLDAVENLAEAQEPEAIPTLIETLSFNNPGAAVAAVEGLILLETAAVKPLMELLDQNNYTARSWAVRALAGIGDPRGFYTLLDAATTDFALSVRRAAARGLGLIQWRWFPDALREIAQQQALEALTHAAQQDEEWVVRYAAIVGLQALALSLEDTLRSQIEQTLADIRQVDTIPTVQARAHWAQRQILARLHPFPQHACQTDSPSPLIASDWQIIRQQLHQLLQTA